MSSELETSAIYLPLHTSVELFSDPAQPPALARAKQAAVLHDRVYVEAGYLDVSVADHGATQFWTPPNQITPEQIARARSPAAPGSPLSFAVGRQPAAGEPPQEMHAILSGTIDVAYGAEWHSEVLDPLNRLGADWIEEVVIGGGEIQRSNPVGRMIADLNYADWTDKSLLQGVPTFKRDFIYKSFNRDAVVAAELGAAFQVTTLFEPMVMRRGFEPAPSGGVALQVLAPNVAELGWETIAEFRAHPAAAEARALMFEFERRAVEQEPRDAAEYLLNVSQQVTDNLFQVIEERRLKLGAKTREEMARAPIAFIPHIGPLIEKGLSGVQLRRQARKEARSVVAALMKLRYE